MTFPIPNARQSRDAKKWISPLFAAAAWYQAVGFIRAVFESPREADIARIDYPVMSTKIVAFCLRAGFFPAP